MSTFSQFIANCEAVIENNNSRTDPFLRAATVRWLKELSNVRALFMQSTFTFNTVANQQEYDSATSGYPVDVQEFDTVYTKTSSVLGASYNLLTGPMPMARIREMWLAGYQSMYPMIWGFHHGKLCFAPTISGVTVVSGDYRKDATRDTASGNAITSADTTTTNPWFDRGENVLQAAVLADYYTKIAKDQNAAQGCIALYQAGLATIAKDLQQKTSAKGAQAVAYFPDRIY